MRDEFLESVKGVAGSVNIMDPEVQADLSTTWAEVRADPVRLQRYAAQAEQANLEQELPAHAGPPVPLPLPMPRSDPHAAGSQIVPFVPGAAAVHSGCVDIQQTRDARAGALQLRTDARTASYPVGTGLLRSVLGKGFAAGKRVGRTYKEHVSDYTNTHNNFAVARDLPPGDAKRPRRPLLTATPVGCQQRRTLLEKRLRQWLPCAAKPHPMASFGKADLFFVFEVEPRLPDGAVQGTSTLYAKGASGNAQAGAVAFRAGFFVCDKVVPQPREDEVLVQLRLEPYIKPRHELPFGGLHTRGRLSHLGYRDIAAQLVAKFASNTPLLITCRSVQFRRVRSHVFVRVRIAPLTTFSCDFLGRVLGQGNLALYFR